MVGRRQSLADQLTVRNFLHRKASNAKRKRVDNAALPAGSPMYYYCKTCGDLIAVLPETHVDYPPQHCEECRYLIDHELMPEEQAHVRHRKRR